MRRVLNRAGRCLLILSVSACSPALDWREARPDGAQAVLLFPCKPELAQRGAMGLAQCKAAGLSFALSWAEVPDPGQVAPALRQMREALAQKTAAAAVAAERVTVPGMTPNAQALTQRLDGGDQHGRVAVFSRGARVYQLTVLGAKRPDDAAWETFLGSVRLQTP